MSTIPSPAASWALVIAVGLVVALCAYLGAALHARRVLRAAQADLADLRKRLEAAESRSAAAHVERTNRLLLDWPED